MKVNELYQVLVRAYSPENLNALSSDIITLYRERDEGKLRQIHAVMHQGDQGSGEKISRIFSQIITIYHPDRQEKICAELKVCRDRNDLPGLKRYDHILDVQQMDLAAGNGHEGFGADFEYGDIWDETMEGYSYFDDEERFADEYETFGDRLFDRSFLSAVKRKVYGHLHVDFPVHLLNDMEIIEMAEYEIEELDGVEHCMYARIIDLSGNNLTDVSPLSQLMRLEEVFLQNNHIRYIDGLNELPFLRIVDLSNNDVDDLSPFFEVESLEFLNVMGNRIPDWQLEKLSLDGVVVVA